MSRGVLGLPVAQKIGLWLKGKKYMKIFFSSSFFVRLFDYRKSIARKEHFKNSPVFFFLEKSHSFSFCVCFFSFSLFLYFFVSTTIHVCHIAFFCLSLILSQFIFLSFSSLIKYLFLSLSSSLSHSHYLSTCLSQLFFLSLSHTTVKTNYLPSSSVFTAASFSRSFSLSLFLSHFLSNAVSFFFTFSFHILNFFDRHLQTSIS